MSSGISWLRSTAPEAIERHQSVLSSPPVICSVTGTPHALHSSFSSARVRSKSRTGTRTSSFGANILNTLCMRYWSLPLPVEPSISASQPSSSAFCATMRATSWRVIEVETG